MNNRVYVEQWKGQTQAQQQQACRTRWKGTEQTVWWGVMITEKLFSQRKNFMTNGGGTKSERQLW